MVQFKGCSLSNGPWGIPLFQIFYFEREYKLEHFFQSLSVIAMLDNQIVFPSYLHFCWYLQSFELGMSSYRRSFLLYSRDWTVSVIPRVEIS